MLPPGLGWSVSDLVLAIQVIYKVSHAIRDADNAEKQYASTIAFLDAFARTIERIKEYIASDDDEAVHGSDLAVQMNLIHAEYTKFDNYLKKYEPGLSSLSFARRIAAKTKWAAGELNRRVADLKKAVLSPMLFITPLLAVETLQQLKAIRARLPSTSLQEASIRENRLLIVKINENLGRLNSSLEWNWWSRSRAMTAVENDIKSLTLAARNNEELLESCKLEMKEAVREEGLRIRREQAAANIAVISAVESSMEARLAWVESSIDVLISQYRANTGREDMELHKIKTRVSVSRKLLQEAAGAARKTLKSFGLVVKAVNRVHSNPVTRWMLPLADSLIGYDTILEEGGKMIKSAGETVTASGKYIEETRVVEKLKDLNPFGFRETAKKQGVGDKEKMVNQMQLPSLLDLDSGDAQSSKSTPMTSQIPAIQSLQPTASPFPSNPPTEATRLPNTRTQSQPPSIWSTSDTVTNTSDDDLSSHTSFTSSPSTTFQSFPPNAAKVERTETWLKGTSTLTQLRPEITPTSTPPSMTPLDPLEANPWADA